MTSRSATIPPVVTETYPALGDHHPTIIEVFTPGTGWHTLRGLALDVDRHVRGRYAKRISPAFARKLRHQGVTAVSLDIGGQTADFTTAELAR